MIDSICYRSFSVFDVVNICQIHSVVDHLQLHKTTREEPETLTVEAFR